MLSTEFDAAVTLIRATLSIYPGHVDEESAKAFLRPLRSMTLAELKRGLSAASGLKRTKINPRDVLDAVGRQDGSDESAAKKPYVDHCTHESGGIKCRNRAVIVIDGQGSFCYDHDPLKPRTPPTICKGYWEDGIRCTRITSNTDFCAMHNRMGNK